MPGARQNYWLACSWLRTCILCCLLAGCSPSEVQIDVTLTGLTADVSVVQVTIQYDPSSTEQPSQRISQGLDRFSITFPVERVTQGEVTLLFSGQDSRGCPIEAGSERGLDLRSSLHVTIEVPMRPLPENSCQLLVRKLGTGQGIVRSDPAQTQKPLDQRIACGPACQVSYPPNTEVALIAEADPDSYFAGWSVGVVVPPIAALGLESVR